MSVMNSNGEFGFTPERMSNELARGDIDPAVVASLLENGGEVRFATGRFVANKGVDRGVVSDMHELALALGDGTVYLGGVFLPSRRELLKYPGLAEGLEAEMWLRPLRYFVPIERVNEVKRYKASVRSRPEYNNRA